jgi:hypothetical protein
VGIRAFEKVSYAKTSAEIQPGTQGLDQDLGYEVDLIGATNCSGLKYLLNDMLGKFLSYNL